MSIDEISKGDDISDKPISIGTLRIKLTKEIQYMQKRILRNPDRKHVKRLAKLNELKNFMDDGILPK